MKEIFESLQRIIGIQVKRYSSLDQVRLMKIINLSEINVLFDVGANTGKYALKMRKLGYRNKIISFEPLSKEFEVLRKNSLRDKNWIVNNYALGNENIKGLINISNNSYSSSIANMLPLHLESAPNSKYINQEEIEIKKFDTIFGSFCQDSNQKIMLKIDTQGYEKNVIDGAIETLPLINILQLEMSLVPLYENEILFVEMIEFLKTKGFMLFSIENGFSNANTGQLLQVDGIFVRYFI